MLCPRVQKPLCGGRGTGHREFNSSGTRRSWRGGYERTPSHDGSISLWARATVQHPVNVCSSVRYGSILETRRRERVDGPTPRARFYFGPSCSHACHDSGIMHRLGDIISLSFPQLLWSINRASRGWWNLTRKQSCFRAHEQAGQGRQRREKSVLGCASRS